MKKVLFLIPSLDRGGAENVLINLVNHMDYEKFDITVQTLFDNNSQKELLNPKIRYKTFWNKQFRGNNFLFSHLPEKFLYKRIVREKYDIVVSYLEGPTSHIISGCPYSDSKKVAWVHVEFNTEKEFSVGFRSKQVALEAYRGFDKIVYVADSVRESFEKIAGEKFDNGTVKYNTVESEKISERSLEPIEEGLFDKSEINLVSVGRIIPAKGYDILARVHKRLCDEGIGHHIYIVGVGAQKDELEHYLSENEVNDAFTFLGFKDNPYKYVKNADLYVCSSRREGFSTAVTESLVVGTPVVSTNCSGAYELLGSNNEYGIVTENDEDSLYEGIKRMLVTQGEIEKYAKKASERGKAFSTKNTVDAVEKMLLEL